MARAKDNKEAVPLNLMEADLVAAPRPTMAKDMTAARCSTIQAEAKREMPNVKSIPIQDSMAAGMGKIHGLKKDKAKGMRLRIIKTDKIITESSVIN